MYNNSYAMFFLLFQEGGGGKGGRKKIKVFKYEIIATVAGKMILRYKLGIKYIK